MRPVRIFLVGFMCSGKSTVGKLLADKLGYTFWDIDQVIEEREGKSIEEIFRDEGEEYFRSLERRTPLLWRK
jgi:shikimate kinase